MPDQKFFPRSNILQASAEVEVEGRWRGVAGERGRIAVTFENWGAGKRTESEEVLLRFKEWASCDRLSCVSLPVVPYAATASGWMCPS